MACLLTALCAVAQGPQPTFQSTVEALKARNYSAALQMASTLVQAHPRDPRAWTLQGTALQDLGRTDKSLGAFQRALEIQPDFLPALEGAAQLEYSTSDPNGTALLERLVHVDPGNQTAHAMLAALAFKRKDFATAATHFERSPEAIASNQSALVEFGLCLIHLRRFQDAVPVFQRLLAARPDDWHSRYNLGLAQFLADQKSESILTLRPLTEGAAPQVDALNLIAAVYEATQQTPSAVAALRRAIEVDPHDVRNYLDFASLCLEHGSFRVGIDMTNAGLKLMPDSPALYAARGVLQVQLSRFDEAEADFEKASQLEPNQSFASVGLGVALLQRNQLSQSLQVVRDRLKRTPDDPALNYLLAEVLMRQGAPAGSLAFEEAKAAAERATRSKPDFVLAHDVLGQLYLESGDFNRSIAESRVALKTDQTDRTAVYHLITALRKSGQTSKIPELLKRLRELAEAELRSEAKKNRFRLVESQSASSSLAAAPRSK